MHQGYVKFNLKYKSVGTAKVEREVLMLSTYDKGTNELRICTSQARYKKHRYRKFLKFRADIFQCDLLNKKPDIKGASRKIDFYLISSILETAMKVLLYMKYSILMKDKKLIFVHST